jgi:hypothetical protein
VWLIVDDSFLHELTKLLDESLLTDEKIDASFGLLVVYPISFGVGLEK